MPPAVFIEHFSYRVKNDLIILQPLKVVSEEPYSRRHLKKKTWIRIFARLLPFFIRIKWICWSWRFSQKLNAASLNTTGLYIYVFFRFQVEFYYHAFPSLNIFKGLKLLPDHANSFLMVKRLSLTVVYYYFADILSRCKIRTLRSLTTLSKHVQSL